MARGRRGGRRDGEKDKIQLKKRIRLKHLEGKRVYPVYRLDKNISWHNFFTYPMGLIYGFITLEWLQKKYRYMIWRLKPWNIWLPPVYAKPYYKYILE